MDAIFFDFDGVILDSLPIKEQGFRDVLAQYPQEQVEKLVEYHELHGGLSRFIKFRHFFEEIRGESITEEQVQALAGQYSKIMKAGLTNKKFLILEMVDFIKEASRHCPCHIVSGTEEKELQYLAKFLGVDHYFISIEGSPTIKHDLVANILQKEGYNPKQCCLIGDATTDYEAAQVNGLKFLGINNESLREKSDCYLESAPNLAQVTNLF